MTSSARLFILSLRRRLMAWKTSPLWTGKPSPIQLQKADPTDSPFRSFSILQDKLSGYCRVSESLLENSCGDWVQRNLKWRWMRVGGRVGEVAEVVRRIAWMNLHQKMVVTLRMFSLPSWKKIENETHRRGKVANSSMKLAKYKMFSRKGGHLVRSSC